MDLGQIPLGQKGSAAIGDDHLASLPVGTGEGGEDPRGDLPLVEEIGDQDQIVLSTRSECWLLHDCH